MYRRYLITGATGFLGRAVLSELLKRDPKAEIVALVLKGDSLAGTLPARVRRVEGDVSRAASLRAFSACGEEGSCVIHCAGIVSVASRPGPGRGRGKTQSLAGTEDKGVGHAPPAGCPARGCFRQAPAPRTIPAARTSRPPAVGSTGSSRFSVP